jgi:hypothetical protein
MTPQSFCLQNTNNLKWNLDLKEKNAAAYAAERLVLQETFFKPKIRSL